jgi:nucleoside-diphosphate-sugar epimerase
MSKPNVIVFGGTGFIGRNLVEYLLKNNLCAIIRVVDKVFPETASMSPDHLAMFENPICKFMQGNLTSPPSIQRCLTLESGSFDYVFNCAAETKYGQEDIIYQEKTLGLTTKLAAEVLKIKPKKFVHLSNAQVYDSSKKMATESSKTNPWTPLAESQLKGDKALMEMVKKGLNLVILRPSIVYGPADVQGISPRVICAAVYKYLGKEMKFLWSGSLFFNTVHVRDVAKAMYHAAVNLPPGSLFNLSDKGDTTVDKLNGFLEKIFGIKIDYFGTLKSTAIWKLGAKSVAVEVNDEHLKPWAELCKQQGIDNTPLTPYLDYELLKDNQMHISGDAIEATGFTYDYPYLTEELIREQIRYFTVQKLFPVFSDVPI